MTLHDTIFVLWLYPFNILLHWDAIHIGLQSTLGRNPQLTVFFFIDAPGISGSLRKKFQFVQPICLTKSSRI